ncbi:hypothetical protein G9C98_006049 [Cotesia typhae]|uniref:Uncharacterized protein n=1 Tax=Cotesia typhae TaxID=2053667 RepID=A0A8J5R3T0_9HYME|nr:hypothetical protein G9C98_006049 [Cotesia typhae]
MQVNFAQKEESVNESISSASFTLINNYNSNAPYETNNINKNKNNNEIENNNGILNLNSINNNLNLNLSNTNLEQINSTNDILAEAGFLIEDKIINSNLSKENFDNETYDKLNIFIDNIEDKKKLDQLVLSNSLMEESKANSPPLNLEQKIIRDGIQNTIEQLAKVSEENENIFDNLETSKKCQLFNEDLLPQTIENGHQSEAVELAIASEEEIPSPWIDVMALAAAPPALRTESWEEINAFPTAVHSLVDLIGPEPYPLELQNQLETTETVNKITTEFSPKIAAAINDNNSITVNSNISSDNNKNERNLLQEITADADICKCVDCKCNETNNCQNCFSEVSNLDKIEDSNSPELNIVNEIVSCLQRQCKNNNDVIDDNDSCCVVICLKTLKKLQRVFKQNCCRELERSVCCKKQTERSNLSFAVGKSQLANNQ